MCEQTEISYLDGDIVWVKLGSSWWPGQVVGPEKLPEDIQVEFQEKPLIAVVKFFREESFEFVKNYQSIYKYNCFMKDDFIRKGLDKYRAKIKDGSNYMNKFPHDVKTAETLTNGNPDILSNEKFSPEKKPDVSDLFGEKKFSKKKRKYEDLSKKNAVRSVTHPRFPTGNDHKIRIGHQPSNMPSSAKSGVGIYPCYVCGFTATRVNVIICHLKNHRSNNETSETIKFRTKLHSESKPKQVKTSTSFIISKKKYARKLTPKKNRNETNFECGKRKRVKQAGKPNKKNKSDPELREKLLADWNVDSDEDECTDNGELMKISPIHPVEPMQSPTDNNQNNESMEEVTCASDLIQKSSEFLQETNNPENMSLFVHAHEDEEMNVYKKNVSHLLSFEEKKESLPIQNSTIEKLEPKEKSIEEPQLSCFDFDEDDVFEPNVSPTRKMSRSLGIKNVSIKKEIIKEFEMKQVSKPDAKKCLEKKKTHLSSSTQSFQKFEEEMNNHSANEKIKNLIGEHQNKKDIYQDFEKTLETCDTQVEILEIVEVRKQNETNVSKGHNTKKMIKDIKKHTAAVVGQSTLEAESLDFRSGMCIEVGKNTILCDRLSENSPVKPNRFESQVQNMVLSCEIRDITPKIEDNSDISNEDDKSEIKAANDCQTSLSQETNYNSTLENLKTNRVVESDGFIIKNESETNVISSDSVVQRTEARDAEIQKPCWSTLDDRLDQCKKSQVVEKAMNDESLKSEDSFKHVYDGGFDKKIYESEKFQSSSSPQKCSCEFSKPHENVCISDREENESTGGKSVFTGVSYESINKESSLDNSNPNGAAVDVKHIGVSEENNFSLTENKFKEENSKYDLENQTIKNSIDDVLEDNDIAEILPEKKQAKEFEISQSGFHENDIVADESPDNHLFDIPDGINLTMKKELSEEMEILEDFPANQFKINQVTNILLPKTEHEQNKSLKDPVREISQDKFLETETIKDYKISNNVVYADEFSVPEPKKLEKKRPDDEDPSLFQNNLDTKGQIKKILNTKTNENIHNDDIEKSRLSSLETNVDSKFENSHNLSLDESILNSCKRIEKTYEPSHPLDLLITSVVEANVPVKKREKPRIIENVTLKEPMILKSKLMEKQSEKIVKHKLESNYLKADELRSTSKAKIFKVDPVICNRRKNFNASGNTQNLPVPSQFLKIEDKHFVYPMTHVKNEEILLSCPKATSAGLSSGKYVQQSSQSLVDMELDINSMPFVLSEDILTPESIEQMPVLISPILPASDLAPKTASTSPSPLKKPLKQKLASNQSFQSTKEFDEMSTKKKGGAPTILKNKSKGKPTITSIKTIVPPITTTAYKGGYKLNTQAFKSSLCNQKIQVTQGTSQKTQGKYVIVQASGPQQAYSMHQKVMIPTSKASGNTQIVQQGSKVVILTSQSNQSGQKVLPLNSLSKSLNSGKINKILSGKPNHEGLTSFGDSKSVLGVKTIPIQKCKDLCQKQPVSKMGAQKTMVFPQSTSKNIVYESCEKIIKTSVLASLPRGILTKDGTFTPITTSNFGRKTVACPNTFTAKSIVQQNSSPSRNLPSPLTTSINNRTIIKPHGIYSKGTILTPITGSQVKALVAKTSKKAHSQSQCRSQSLGSHTMHKNITSVTHSNTSIDDLNDSISKKTESNDLVVDNAKEQFVNNQEPKILKPLFPHTSISTKHKKSRASIAKIELNIVDNGNANQFVEETPKESTFEPRINRKKSTLNKLKSNERNETETSEKLSIQTNSDEYLEKKLIDNAAVGMSGVSIPVTSSSIESTSSENISKETLGQENTTSEYPIFKSYCENEKKLQNSKVTVGSQIMALSTDNNEDSPTYVLVSVNDQGQIVQLDNNTLMTLDSTSNIEASRTIYIDSNSLSNAGNLDNILLQIDNSSLSNLQHEKLPEPIQTTKMKELTSIETGKCSNQDILAAALANTDFHEISMPEAASSATKTNLADTSLINQTILQSTIIPPAERISSPLVVETSLTLNQPIMTPLVVPSNLHLQSDRISTACAISTPISPKLTSIDTIDEHNTCNDIEETSIETMKESMPKESEESTENISADETDDIRMSIKPCSATPDSFRKRTIDHRQYESQCDLNQGYSIAKDNSDKKLIQSTPSMPILDDSNTNLENEFTKSLIPSIKGGGFATKESGLMKDSEESDPLKESLQIHCIGSASKKGIFSPNQQLMPQPIQLINDIQDHCVPSQEEVLSTTGISENTFKGEKIECSRKDEEISVNDKTSSEIFPKFESLNDMHSFESTHKKKTVPFMLPESAETSKKTFSCADEKIEFKRETKVDSESEKTESTGDSKTLVDSGVDELCHLTEREKESKIKTRENKVTNPPQSYQQPSSVRSDSTSISESSVESANWQEAFPTRRSLSHSLVEPIQTDEDGSTTDKSNLPSQSYQIAKVLSQSDESVELIGSSLTVSLGTLNEDEIASSSYVPETPETQERDQDQESAISTSSYEIPPCEELNIGSSSVAVDTSNTHSNGTLELPSSSYSLVADSSSSQIDTLPTSSLAEQLLLEQRVSTSYEVGLPMVYDTSSASEVAVSHAYFSQEEAASNFDDDFYVTDRSSSSVKAQSFYQEDPREQQLSMRGEASPSYTSQYSLEYAPVHSPLGRNDIVDSSMPSQQMKR